MPRTTPRAASKTADLQCTVRMIRRVRLIRRGQTMPSKIVRPIRLPVMVAGSRSQPSKSAQFDAVSRSDERSMPYPWYPPANLVLKTIFYCHYPSFNGSKRIYYNPSYRKPWPVARAIWQPWKDSRTVMIRPLRVVRILRLIRRGNEMLAGAICSSVNGCRPHWISARIQTCLHSDILSPIQNALRGSGE